MKKILFVVPTLQNGGGVIRSLQNFLSVIPKDKYDIFVLSTGYSSSDNVRLSNCKILKGNLILESITSIYYQTEGHKHRRIIYWVKVLLNILNKFHLRKTFVIKCFKTIAKSYSDFDTVIAFQEGTTTQFVSFIKASNKIAWIHCDYKEYFKSKGTNEFKMYDNFNLILSVSKFTKNNFDTIYPQLSFKSDYIYNYLNSNYIVESSKEGVSDIVISPSKLIFISIGRICAVKQFNLIPLIISQLLSKGCNSFKWILMGVIDDKKEFQKIQEEVKKYNISTDYFEYIGKRMNPYPYIKKADILISTSKSEACPFVVNEAKVLNIPVVSNNYPSIYEFINDGKNGFICDVNSMSDLLFELITNREKMNLLKMEISQCPFSNKETIVKFNKILGM